MAELPCTLSGIVPSASAGAPRRSLLHAIRVCPLSDTLRHTGLERVSLQRVAQFGDAELLRWILDLFLVLNNHSADSAVGAHVHYVAAICQTAISFKTRVGRRLRLKTMIMPQVSVDYAGR